MITDYRRKNRRILGEKQAEELRLLILSVVSQKWEIPTVRFSPPLAEHLLYFVAQNYVLAETELFPILLKQKFLQEYGYADYPSLVPNLLDDLLEPLRNYLSIHFNTHKIAPQRAVEKAMRKPLLLFLDGIPLHSKTRESIGQLSGLPTAFLEELVSAFQAVRTRNENSCRCHPMVLAFLKNFCETHSLFIVN